MEPESPHSLRQSPSLRDSIPRAVAGIFHSPHVILTPLCFASFDSSGIRRLSKADGYFFRSESYFNVATQIQELDALEVDVPKVIKSYGDTSLHEQSHGESFWSLVTNRFGGNGLYIFDKPEAALSPSRQLSLLAAIYELTQRDSQFIVATHSPILMAFPEAAIYLFSETGIEPTSYEQTEHYKITKAFLDSPERMLRQLFAGQSVE